MNFNAAVIKAIWDFSYLSATVMPVNLIHHAGLDVLLLLKVQFTMGTSKD